MTSPVVIGDLIPARSGSFYGVAGTGIDGREGSPRVAFLLFGGLVFVTPREKWENREQEDPPWTFLGRIREEP